MNIERITIRAFSATQDQESCARFSHEHSRVLKDIGVHNVVKPAKDWAENKDTTVFVAEHAELGMIGGFRLQLDTPERPLPMEHALIQIDPRISQSLALLRSEGNAEMTALWTAHRFSGRGLPLLLMSSLVAAASQLPIKHLSILASQYMAPYAIRLGCWHLTGVGNDGVFNYPIDGLRSSAMSIPDLQLLSGASEKDRRRVFGLRLRPQQVRMELPRLVPLEVCYELLLEPSSMLAHYRSLELVHQRYAA